MNAIQFPLSRITVAFVFGILFAHLCDLNFILAGLSIGLSFLTFCLFYFGTLRKLQPNGLFGLATYGFSFCLGVFTYSIHSVKNQKDHYIHQVASYEKPQALEIVIREKLKSSANYERYVGLVEQIDHKECSGKIILNFDKGTLSDQLEIGTPLDLVSIVVPHQPPLNPYQFDYGRYLATKSIPAQIYMRKASFRIGRETVKDLYYYSDQVRSNLLDNLQKANFNRTELHVLAALLLGQQQEISQEVVRDYQLAGAVHMLSVSGLHVGFIILFVGFLLRPLPQTVRGKRIRLLLTLISLWSFAFLAGLSPSVIRSVTMFSFVTIGLYLKRSTNTFHTLLVSLLLILILEPSFLFDVGFQLSYLALFFILWMQPLLSSIWEPKNKITSYLWDTVTVSFAAQIGTFPLSVYYFHQFPSLFFVSNLITIPFLTLIMALGLVLLLLSSGGITPILLVLTVEKLIAWLNRIIHTVASFDQFVFSGISLHWSLVLSLYFVIFFCTWYCMKTEYKRLFWVMIALILLHGNYLYLRWQNENQAEWIVFHLAKSTLIAERNGKEVMIFTDGKNRKKEPLASYLIATNSKVFQERPLQNLLYVYNKKIAILDSTRFYPANSTPDVLLLCQSPKVNLERVFKSCKPKLVIADASNYRSYVALWRDTCIKEKIPFHNTYEKGFYRLK